MKTTRRGLLRKGSAAIAGGGLVGVGARKRGIAGPVGSAQAIVPLALAGAAAAAGLGYMAYEVGKGNIEIAHGDNGDYSGYTGGTALIDDITAGVVEMQSADERVLTSIRNNIANSENVSLAKAKAAVIRAMNNGATESEAKTAMNDEINAYYSKIQANILKHWNSQLEQLAHHHQQIVDHSDTNPANQFELRDSDATLNYDSTYGWQGFHDLQMTLLDGTDHLYHTIEMQQNSGSDTDMYSRLIDFLDQKANVPCDGPNSYHGTPHLTTPVFNGKAYHDEFQFTNAWNDLKTKRDDVNQQMQSFVSDVYSAYEPGEIPTEDLIDPITASTELNQDYSHYSIQSAHAAMMGIPSNAELSLVMEVYPPNDETFEMEADIYTKHVPTDSDGNKGFKADGETVYEPSTWADPLYVAYKAYDVADDGTITNEKRDFQKMEKPFTILKAEDADGKEVTKFKNDAEVNQTADVAAIEEELDQLRQKNRELQNKAQAAKNRGGSATGGNPGVGASMRSWAKERPAEAAGVGGGLMATLYALSGAGGA